MEKNTRRFYTKCRSSVQGKVCAIDKSPLAEAPAKVVNAMVQAQIYCHSLATSDSLKNNSRGFWQTHSESNLMEIGNFDTCNFQTWLQAFYMEPYEDCNLPQNI